MAVNAKDVTLKHRNLLLSRSTDLEWERLKTQFEHVEFAARHVLHESFQVLHYAYFPLRGCISQIVKFADGFCAEVGIVGHEGMIGVPLLHGLKTDISATVVQLKVEALRVSSSVLLKELEEMPSLRSFLLSYCEAVRVQAMQIAACNAHHSLLARLARSILSFRDRHTSNELPLTHESLATLLSAHRPSVSVAVNRLKQDGLVKYSSGMLVVADRDGLEAAACECYNIIRSHGLSCMG